MEFDLTLFNIPIIVTCCYWIGFAVKKSKRIDDNYIPAIVVVCGAIIGLVGYFVGLEGFSPNSWFTALVLGIISGGFSTCINQIIKQFNKGR